jgi:serine/threonine-protein kinase
VESLNRYGVETVVLSLDDDTPTVEIMAIPDDDPAYAPTLPPTVPAPVPLGSLYYLEHPIGQGANGRVWRGVRRADGQPVAIKVLREEYTSDPEAVARFLRERTALRAVVHPNLVRVLDLVVEGDTLAIVMDLVDGDNLRAVTRTQAFAPDRAITVLGQIAAALATVHAAGIVHRDVKPENVLITWRGGEPWARLTDFGIAKVAGGETLTRHSQVVGTPAYVAPEVAMSRPPGPAADVYALGVMAYELFAGRRPFVAEHAIALMRAHLEDEPVRPDGLGDAVWSVVAVCLAKRPEQRPTAGELADRFAALHGRAGALPVGAPPPVPVSNPPPVLRTNPPIDAGPADAIPVGALPVDPWAGVPELLPTSGPTTPVPDEPPPPAAKRRWLVPALMLLVLALAATAAGIWYGGRDDRDTKNSQPDPSQSSSQPVSPYQFYPVAVTATSPRQGAVQLDFADASSLPGFHSYLVYREGELIIQLESGTRRYVLTSLDPKTEYCYRVLALVETKASPPSDPPPSCITAKGR